MHRSRHPWPLGLPHTTVGSLSEIALLAQAQHLHWSEIGGLVGCPATRLLDAHGGGVFASISFADFVGDPGRGLAAYRPDDVLDLVGTLARFGRSLLEGRHRIYPAGILPDELPGELPPAPEIHLSFVLVSLASGNDELRVATPHNARIEAIPSMPREPDSYRLVRAARAAGAFPTAAPAGERLWPGAYQVRVPINRDRDLNGVGLLYFANYVAFLDAAERRALEDAAGMSAASLDGRVTVRRRIAYFGNAQPSDQLDIEVEAERLPSPTPGRLRVDHRVRRVSDGRLIAVASAERQVRGEGS